jgi:pantetheine-phosphate adenylyltransferase
MKRIAVFPGSFDPFTKGHEAVVRKALNLFEEVIIGIGVNSTKNYQFTLEKRTQHITSLFSASDHIRVVNYQKLTVDLCKAEGAQFIVRGLRDSKDFEYEKPIAQMNEALAGIETVFLLTNQEYSAISSSIIREIYKNEGDITQFVTNAHLLV